MSVINVALAVQGSQKPPTPLVPVHDPNAFWASLPPQERAIRGGMPYVLRGDKVMPLAEVIAALDLEAAKPKKNDNTGSDKAIPGVQEQPKRVLPKGTPEANRKMLEPRALPAVVIMKKPGKSGKIYVSKKVSMKDLHDNAEEYCLAMWCRTPAEASAEAQKLEECRADNVLIPATWPADKAPQSLTPKEIAKLPTEAEGLNKIRRSDVTASQVFGGPADMRDLDVAGQPPFKHRALVPEERQKPCGHALAYAGEVAGTGPRVCDMCGYREEELDDKGCIRAGTEGDFEVGDQFEEVPDFRDPEDTIEGVVIDKGPAAEMVKKYPTAAAEAQKNMSSDMWSKFVVETEPYYVVQYEGFEGPSIHNGTGMVKASTK